MPSYSSSSQNTRVFAPYAIVTQDTSRLFIKIKNDSSNVGYAVDSGITLGDVVRFNPLYTATGVTGMYTRSRADDDVNAEVLGVVESISNNNYTIVTHGSIAYPASRLVGLCGACGGVDILFLSSGVSGGLTGTIDMSAAGTRIIKPVLQMAPHGAFNAVVVNYIGFRAGSDNLAPEEALLGTGVDTSGAGNVEYRLPNATLNSDPNWLLINEDTQIIKADNAYIFSLYGTNYGPWEELVSYDFVDSETTIQVNVGDRFEQINGNITQTGIVSSIERTASSNIVHLIRSSNTTQFLVNKRVAILNNITKKYSIATIRSSSIYLFTVPGVNNPIDIVQGGTVLQPYIRIKSNTEYNNNLVSNNSIITIQNLVVGQTLSVGQITDVESKLNYLQQQIDQISGRF